MMERTCFSQVIPDPSPAFHHAMEQALEKIAAQEEASSAPAPYRRRTAAYILLAALLLAAAALAVSLHPGVLDILVGSTSPQGQALIQRDLAKVSYAHCDVEVKEAAYDGVSLYILYSIRDREATTPLPPFSEPTAGMEADQVGWWIDHLWVNGVCVDMPSMSGGEVLSSEAPGEILYYDLWRLDQAELFLDGRAEIALPIGQRQDWKTLPRQADGSFAQPEAGVVVFTLDIGGRDHVLQGSSAEERVVDGVTASVAEYILAPIQSYITLKLSITPQRLAAYCEEMGGEGFYDTEGTLLWRYGVSDVATWLYDLTLVDGSGTPIAPDSDHNGLQGISADTAWYTFVSPEDFPQEIFLAPLEGGKAKMEYAIRVR